VPEAGRLNDSVGPVTATARRRAVGAGLVVVALGLATVAIYRERDAFTDAVERIGAAPAVASFAAAGVAVGVNLPLWQSVLRSLGVEFPRRVEARIFFVSQLGKYVPGAIWPLVIQMEAARRHRAPRQAVASANLITLALSSSVGLVLACALLPISDGHVLARYWWVLLALPPLVALLHPRIAPSVINRLLMLAGRQPIAARLDPRATARAAAWSLISWLAVGAHVAILALAVGGGGLSTLVLCAGAAPLAVVAGIVAVPIPAGVGIRDAILGLVLAVNLSGAEAIAVVVTSRVMLILADLVLAGAASLPFRRASGVPT
jgi:glycosyltransferase 2 family protein